MIMASCALVSAQDEYSRTEAVESAERHIVKLKNGILLVRLPSNARKIEAIQTMLDTADLDQKDQEKLVKLLETTMAETEDFNSTVIEGFSERYDFSDVGYFYDSDSRLIKSGEKRPFDSDLKTPKSIDTEATWYILSIGNTPGMSIKGYVVLDTNLDPLPRPFPATVTRGGFNAIVELFTNDPEKRNIERLNKKLHKYYDSVARKR